VVLRFDGEKDVKGGLARGAFNLDTAIVARDDVSGDR
jgi:hypothetical protein